MKIPVEFMVQNILTEKRRHTERRELKETRERE
jgi:hypothetical protein